MSTPLSFLASIRHRPVSLSLRKVLLAIVFTGATVFYCSRCGCTTETVEDLDNAISSLTATTNQTQTDVNAALLHLKTETNLIDGPLMVGGVISTKPGDTVDVPITFVAGMSSVASLQMDLVVPDSFTIVSVTPGPAATAAGKQIETNNGRVIIFGLNQTLIGPGVVATVQVQVPATQKDSLCVINLEDPVASDASGTAVVVSGTSGTIEVAQ